MVWSRLKVVCLVVCMIVAIALCNATTSHAVSYSAYDGNISTSQLTYFRDIVSNIGINDSYVFFRANQYDYKLVVGSLKNDGATFIANPSDYVTIYNLDTETSYNSAYSYDVSREQNFSLDASDKLVYSNLGNYPSLDERGTYYAFATFFVIVVIGICALIRPLFNFVLRIIR